LAVVLQKNNPKLSRNSLIQFNKTSAAHSACVKRPKMAKLPKKKQRRETSGAVNEL